MGLFDWMDNDHPNPRHEIDRKITDILQALASRIIELENSVTILQKKVSDLERQLARRGP